MKYLVPVLIAVAVITVALTTALAQYRHAPPLTLPYLYGYIFAFFLLAAIGVIALNIARQEQATPRIAATRYGEGSMGTGIHSHGYPVGKSGLILVNDGEPAYEIGVYPPNVALGVCKLHFENTIRRLTKEDGEAQLSTWIEQSERSGVLGSGLFEFMRQNKIADTTIPLRYKSSNERWYKTVCRIERDVVHSSDGLVITSRFRGRTWKPRT